MGFATAWLMGRLSTRTRRQDLDLAVALDNLPRAEALTRQVFKVERFPHSLNISEPGSDLRVHLPD